MKYGKINHYAKRIVAVFLVLTMMTPTFGDLMGRSLYSYAAGEETQPEESMIPIPAADTEEPAQEPAAQETASEPAQEPAVQETVAEPAQESAAQETVAEPAQESAAQENEEPSEGETMLSTGESAEQPDEQVEEETEEEVEEEIEEETTEDLNEQEEDIEEETAEDQGDQVEEEVEEETAENPEEHKEEESEENPEEETEEETSENPEEQVEEEDEEETAEDLVEEETKEESAEEENQDELTDAEAEEPIRFMSLRAVPSTEDQTEAEEEEEQEEESGDGNQTALLKTAGLLGASGSTDEDDDAQTPSIPALQKIINDALFKLEKLSGTVQVLLSKNTVYEGDIDINASRKTVEDDFALEMVAEDAAVDETAGNGYTTINGNVTIRGIRVIMNSITIDAAKKIRVENAGDMAGENQSDRGGELVYNGTVNYNNTLNLEVGNNSSAEVNLGGTNDKVNITMESGAESLVLDAGDGLNTVNVTVAGGDADIRTGSNMDTLNLTVEGKVGTVHADSGAGVDEVTVVHNGVSGTKDLYVTTGEGDDNLTVDVRENAGDITIDTGLGGDNVTVSKGNHHTFETIDYNQVHNPYERIRDDASTSTVTFVNSDPDAFDHFVIDVNAAGAVSTIAFKGGKGASVHLKGTLATDPAPGTGKHTPIWRDKNGDIVLNAMVWDSSEVDRTLTLSTAGEGDGDAASPTYNLTDNLINKRTIYLYAMGNKLTDGGKTFTYDGATEDFTNYVLRTAVNDLNKIIITGSDKPLTLSNIVIDTAQTLDYYVGDDAPDGDYGYLKVPNIEAKMLNVLLKGRTIQLMSGRTVEGQNVRFESAEGTKTAGQAFANLTRSGEGYDSILSSLEDTVAGVGQTFMDLMTIYYKSRLNIDGTIKAAHDIDLQARSKLFGNILGLWPDVVNFLNVKIGLAEIEIGENARLTAEDNITAEAKVETSVGMTYNYDDKSGKGTLAKSGPFAQISVVYNSASVNVLKGAVLTAKDGDVLLRSSSKATAGEYAHAGAFDVPAAIALGIIMNNANTEVNGTVTAGRKAELKAVGKVLGEAETIKDGTLGSSGYFVAGNLVYQDVNAIAGQTAKITGRKDVRIESRADADVRTLANSAGIQGEDTATGTAIANFFGALIPVLKTKLFSLVDDPVHLRKAETALNAVFDKGYTVKAVYFSAEEKKKGSVYITTREGKSDLGNDQTLIVVAPNPAAGYETDKVYYRYLAAGVDHYTYFQVTKKDRAGNYVFVPITPENNPPDQYEIIVTFKEAAKEGEPLIEKGIKEHEDSLIEDELEKIDANELEEAEEIKSLIKLIEEPLKGLDQEEALDEDDEKFQDVNEADRPYTLAFDPGMTGGKIVTWLLDKKTGKSISKLASGQTVRLVPNPGIATSGVKNELKTLNVTYETKDGYTEVINIAQDSSGYYSFTVPENAKDGAEFLVQATFTVSAAPEKEAAHSQTSGAIALSAVKNYSNAVIQGGSTVATGVLEKDGTVTETEGDVELLGLKTTKSTVSADGTGVTSASGKTKSSEEEEEKVRLEPGDPKYQVGNAMYAIEMTSNVTGAVQGTTNRSEGGSALAPKFTITPPKGADISKTIVRLTYYSKWDFNLFGGTMTTQDFHGSDFVDNEDGTYTFKPDLNYETIQNGQVMNMSMIFVDADGNALETQEGSETAWLVRNPIATVVNELRQKDENGKYVHYSDSSVGELQFYGLENIEVTEKVNTGRTAQDLKDGTDSSEENTETRTETHTIYKFKVANEENYRGYTVDESYDANHKSSTDALYACWYDGGELVKAPLTHKDGYWYFDPADANYHVPAGVEITVVANFTEDLRDIKVEKQKDDENKVLDYGTVSVNKSEAKFGDTVTVTLKGKDGYYPKSVTVSYVAPGAEKVEFPVFVTQDASSAAGTCTITIPWIAEGSDFTITPEFVEKNIVISTDESIKLNITDGMTFANQQLQATPKDSSNKLAELTITYLSKDGKTTKTTTINCKDQGSATKGIFTVSGAEGLSLDEIGSVIVSAKLEEKTYDLETAKLDDGSLVPASKKADAGDTVKIKIVPKEGYKAKYGTVKARIRFANGGVQSIVMTRSGVNEYEFTLPSDDNGTNKLTNISFEADFEPGSDDLERSLGASLAVSYVDADNNVEIQDGSKVTAGRNLQMIAISDGGKAETVAKAGYSKGITGIAGAIALQIADVDTRSVIRKGATVSIGVAGGGNLNMLAKAAETFKVTGNAMGEEQTDGTTATGVGSGIAFAIDSITSQAEVEDGAVFDSNKSSMIHDIKIDANHKTKTTIDAIAGAAGGSSYVPVLAVEIFNSEATAKMGWVTPSKAAMTTGNVTIKAKSESAQVNHNHEITADAAAKGEGVAMGGSFIVTWLKTDVQAILNQALDAGGNVTVTAYAADALKAVAKAGASGGYEGKKSADGKGSADQRADSILSNAAGLAGKNGAEIRQSIAGRQLAETAESTVTGAGAFILNMQQGLSLAEIGDVDITAKGAVTVRSANRTEGFIRANASAARSTFGIGVGVALNIFKMDNIARIGTGKIDASALTVEAIVAEAPPELWIEGLVENPEVGSTAKSNVEAKLEGVLRDLLGDTVYDAIGSSINTFVSTFWAVMVDDLNLQQLLDLADDKSGGFSAALDVLIEKIKGFGNSLIDPYISLAKETMESVEGFDISEFGNFLVSEMTSQLAANAYQALIQTILKNGSDELIGATVDMLTNKLQGKPAGIGSFGNRFKALLVKSLKTWGENMVNDLKTKFQTQFTFVNSYNLDKVEKLFKKMKDMTLNKFKDEAKDGIVTTLKETFREEVYDYEKIATQIEADGGVLEYLQTELKRLLTESAVAMTTELIDSVIGKLGVDFTRELVDDRHVITTQAIAGSGAKTTSAAGSVALAVVNMNTSATISESENPIKITGDGALIVNAEELRRVRTHATAAVDARNGEDPDNNDGAGYSENADNGGNGANGSIIVRYEEHEVAPKIDDDEDEQEISNLIAEKDEDDEDDIFIRRKDDNKEAAKEELLDDSVIKIDDDDRMVINEHLHPADQEEGHRQSRALLGDGAKDGNEEQKQKIKRMFKSAVVEASPGLKLAWVDENSDLVRVSAEKGYILPKEFYIQMYYNKTPTSRIFYQADYERVAGKEGEEDYILFHLKGKLSEEDLKFIDEHEVPINALVRSQDGELKRVEIEIPEPKIIPDPEEKEAIIEEEKKLPAYSWEKVQSLVLDNTQDPEFQEEYKDKVTVKFVGPRSENGKPVLGKGAHVSISIGNIKGYTPYEIAVFLSEKDKDGNQVLFYHPENPTDRDWKGITEGYKNEVEQNFQIFEPEVKIKSINVIFRKDRAEEEQQGEGQQGEGQQGEEGQQDEQEPQEEMPDGWENLAGEAAGLANGLQDNAVDQAGRKVGIGAAFSMTYGESDVTAEIGARNARTEDGYDITAGSIAVTASSDHEEENYATAGTDPFEGTTKDTKDAGVDASVSVNILDNDIVARIANDTRIRTTGTPDAEETETEASEEDEDDEEQEDIEIERKAGDLIVHAHETSKNETKSSAFATGSATAIGASVAVNISKSDIDAHMGADATVSGDASIRGYSRSQDRTWSFASSMGADLQRALNKVADVTDSIEKSSNKLANGEIYNQKAEQNDESKNTKTANRIANRMNDDQVKNAEGDKAAGNMSVSTNALRSQNAKMDAGKKEAEDQDKQEGEENKGVAKAGELIQDKAMNNINNANLPGLQMQEETKLQVAATVGVTVALHDVAVRVDGSIRAAGDISVTSQNAGNFNTRSTAASMTLANMMGGKSIAAAVGVSVNNNKSTIDIGNDGSEEGEAKRTADLISDNGDVTVDADLTQNLTGVFRGYLAVQSIAGSVSGANASQSIAGAVSTLVSHADTTARINQADAIEGDTVAIRANDKSKLAIRAGSINVSTSASTGMGASVATIWSGNGVQASVNEKNGGTKIKANSFELTARKEKVTIDDYSFPLNMSTLITDSSELTDEQRENVYTGFIDVHKKPGEKSYTIDINVDSYALMQAADALNFLSSNNYYAESIAGSAVLGSGMGGAGNNWAGSFSIVRASNTVDAVLGNNILIDRKTPGRTDGAISVAAIGETTARILGGAASVGKAKGGAGVTVTFLYDRDNVDAKIGDGFKVVEGGDVSVRAEGEADVENYNAAAAVNYAADGAAYTLGGALNLMIMENTADVTVGKNADVDAKGKLTITADTDMDLKLISGSTAVALDSTAAGGTISFINDIAKSRVKVGKEHSLRANDNVNIKASTNDFLLSVNVSASAAVKGGSGFAGAVNILHGGTVGTVELEDSEAGIMSRGGSVAIRGNTNTKAVNVTAGAAGSGTANAIGLSINMNFFDRTSGVDIGGGDKYSIIAKKDILISSKGNDTTGLGALAIAGGQDFVLSGNAAVVVSENDVRTRIGNGLIAAGGEVAINSHLRDLNVTAAGTVAVGLSDASYGATYMMIYKENNVKTDLGKATVRAEGESGALAELVPGLEDGAFSGLYVGATMSQTTVAAAAGVGTGKEMGVEGNVLNVNNLNKVKAILSKATVKALRNEGTGAGSATVESGIDASNIIISGGFNASKNMSVGVGIVTLVSDNDVQSMVNNIEAEKDIHVRASNQEKLVQANVQAGFAKEMSVETGISFQLIESDVLAKILGKANAVYGSLHLESHNDITQVNATVTVGTIAPVAVLNFYSGSSEASLAGDKAVQAAGAVRVNATSDKQVDLFTVGAAATNNAVSGSLSLSFLKDQTRAIMGKNVQLEAQSLDVQAQSDYGLIGVSGAIALSNQDTVAINLMLSFPKSLALAEVEGQAVLKGGEATVQARSHRDVLDIGATASLSGFGLDTSKGTGVTVAGLIAGSRMDQDAADMMVYGKINKDEQNQSNQSEQRQKTFDENKLKSQMDSGLSWTRNKNLSSKLEEQTDEEGNVTRSSLTDDLRGSGTYAHEMEVGSGDSFDATSGIVSDEFYEERQGPTEGDTQLGSKETDPEDDGSYMHDRNENMGYGEHASIDDSENEDIQKARKLGHSVYDEEPSDSVIARIGADANITAAGVNVQAIQGTEADIVGGTLVHGGLTGLGISAAFAELHSNVSASSMGTLNVQDGNINIQAMSVGGDVEDVAQGSGTKQSEAAFLIGLNDEEDNTYRQEDRDNAVSAGIRGGNEKDEGALGDNPLAMDAEEQEDNTEKEIKVDQQSIRVIGLSVVGSKTTAEAVAVSVLRTDNVTQAVAGGTMNNVGAMNVKATADYDDISAITLGIGLNTQNIYGTEYAFAGSVGVVAASGEVDARIDSTAAVTGTAADISVISDASIHAASYAATAAGGGAFGGAAGVSVVSNQLDQNASVDRGARIIMTDRTQSGSLKVQNISDTTADSYLIGVTEGKVLALGLGAAVSIISPTVNASIGDHGDKGVTTLANVGDVLIKNDVESEGNTGVLSVSIGDPRNDIGGFSAQANALLVFNDTAATAKAVNTAGTMKNLTIEGEVGAEGDSKILALNVGSLAAGLGISYVDVSAKNTNTLDLDTFTAQITDTLKVIAGEDTSKKSLAKALSISGQIAKNGTAGLNVAIALNRTENNAIITSKEKANNLNAANVYMNAQSNGSVRTRMYGLNVAQYAAIGASISFADNEATSRVAMKVNGALTGNLNVNSGTQGTTKSYMLTGNGALVGVAVNVGAAYGRTNSIIDVDVAKGPVKKGTVISVNANNSGNSDKVIADINNQNVAFGTASAMVGVAYSQDTYSTKLRLGGDYTLSALNAHTDYDVHNTAYVSPSIAGFDISGFNVYGNGATAKNTVYAGTEVILAGTKTTNSKGTVTAKGGTVTAGDISVTTEGKAYTESEIRSAKFTLAGVMLGLSWSEAKMNGSQAAFLTLDNSKVAAKDVRVESISKGSEASAVIGTSGRDADGPDFEMTGLKIGINRALAIENLDSSAGIRGSDKKKDQITADSLQLNTMNESGQENRAYSKTHNAAQFSLISSGALLSQSVMTENYHTLLDHVTAKIKGKVNLSARTNALSEAVGTTPGGLTVMEASYSEMKSYLGDDEDRQTAKVLIGDDTELITEGTDSDIIILAENKGNTKAEYDGGYKFSLGSITVSKVPTGSWYDTGVLIGKNSRIASGGKATIQSQTSANAASEVEAFHFSIALNLDFMSGKNVINDTNTLNIGQGTKIEANGNVTVQAKSDTIATAKSDYSGGAVVVSGSVAWATNDVKRDVRVNIDRDTDIKSTAGTVNIRSASGENDWIYTKAKSDSAAIIFGYGRAEANTKVNSNNEIHTGAHSSISGDKGVNIIALATEKQASGIQKPGGKQKPGNSGVFGYAQLDLYDLLLAGKALSNMEIRANTLVDINRGTVSSEDQANLKSDNGNILIHASNKGMSIRNQTHADAGGAIGDADADSPLTVYLLNTAWIDNVMASALTTSYLAGDETGYPSLETRAHAAGYVLGGNEADADIRGSMNNQVRTNDDKRATPNGNFIHLAYDPAVYLHVLADADMDGIGDPDATIEWSVLGFRCDFCKAGADSVYIERTTGLTEIMEKALAKAMKKALIPLNEIQSTADEVMSGYKARYGEEEYDAASLLYVLEIASLLEKDVRLGEEKIRDYRMWMNTETFQNVYLLPNAARMYTQGSIHPQYIAEVLYGDFLGDGVERNIDVITALTANAIRAAQISIGSRGSLNFRTGELTVPEQSDFELYLHEVSGAWMMKNLKEGFFRRYAADQKKANEFAMDGAALPEGAAEEGLVEGGRKDSWLIYWLGHDPETALSPEETLVYLLFNPETDEVDAFRTSVEMLDQNETPIDVSVYLFRDAEADRAGEEKYNILCFDTPAGEKSLFKVITDLMGDDGGYGFSLPKTLKVVLRGRYLEGADLPVYSMTDHYFALCDGTDGFVEMFGGEYTARIGENTFEDDYLRIDNLREGEMSVTLRKNQPVWPEWTGTDTAQDVGGKKFVMIDGVWYNQEMAPAVSETYAEDDAA